MTVISTLIDKLIRQREKQNEREHSIHRTGYVTLNREINNYISIVREFFEITVHCNSNTPVKFIKNAVTELYDTLETEYGAAVSIDEHIEFEVTFMSESYVDGKITIAAWANRDGRAPKSLRMRQTNSDIYSETETAKLYADENKTVRIVESASGSDYKELYPGQKTRIQSSVIYPVLDDAFTLVGALVVHCDKKGFFRKSEVKFWRELLEPYTKRLALAAVAADKLSKQSPSYKPF